MAKFRSNHAKQSDAGGGAIVKVGIFGAILGGLFFLFNQFGGGGDEDASLQDDTDVYVGESYYLPEGGQYQIISYDQFSLAYDEQHEQAAWVAYILTRDNLTKEWNDRNDNFRADPRVKSGSATPSDYRSSGYDRGHLVPAADMAWNPAAQDETFYMSNISPQSHNFNTGIWRELEENVRNWAKKEKQLYVVTGPILTRPIKGSIGKNEVSIPAAYFKILLDLTEPQMKGIGFILPNEISYEPLFKYATSIDAIEEATGLDFFAELMPNDLEEEIESRFNIDLWSFSKKKYDQRVNKWNKEQR